MEQKNVCSNVELALRVFLSKPVRNTVQTAPGMWSLLNRTCLEPQRGGRAKRCETPGVVENPHGSFSDDRLIRVSY